MNKIVRPLVLATLLTLLAGCASTTHYYSASDYRGIRVGDAKVTSGVSVRVSPSGVSITPRVRYYHSRKSGELK